VAHFYLLVLLAALWTLEAPARRRFAFLGAAVGSCLYFRLDAFAVGAAIAGAVALDLRLPRRAILRHLSSLAAGLAAASVPMVVHLWHLGVLPDFGRQLLAFGEQAGSRAAAWYRLAPPPLDALGQATATGFFAWLFYGSLLVPAWLLGGFVLRLTGGGRGRSVLESLPPRTHLVLLIWLLGNVPQYAIERPDVAHLAQRMPALVVAGVSLAAACARGRTGDPRIRRRLVPTGLVVAYLVAYLGFALRYGHGGSLTAALGGIETVALSNGQRFAQVAGGPWDDVAEHLLAHTRPGDAVAALPYLPGVNFLTERPLPTRHVDLLPPSLHEAATEQAYIDALERSAVGFVVVDEDLRFNGRDDTALPRYAPRLAEYLERRYVAERRYGNVTVLR
ncbi:MAG: hypothetical protein ACRD2T_07970, partial [Thermoanaerobaculia bacterium]